MKNRVRLNSTKKGMLLKALQWTTGVGVTISFVGMALSEGSSEESFYIIWIFLLVILLFVFSRIKSIIRLKNEQKKTELLHLQSQVNPHFFFNTLNNLYGMIEKGSKARDLVLKLSDMMRYSIYEGQKDQVTIGEELEYLKNYIDLQQTRYHKQTNVQFNHKIDNEQCKVMPLLFIILVENAFKHGLENLEENANVYIDLTTNKGEIHLTVENNFELSDPPEQPGIGLKNLKRRLELSYPNQHSLSFERNKDVFKVKLSLELND